MTILTIYLLIALVVFAVKVKRMLDFNRRIQRYYRPRDLIKPAVISLLWLPAGIYFLAAFIIWRK